MSSLIICLPLTGPATGSEFDYVLVSDEQTLTRQGRVSTALLPTLSKLADEIIALAPVQALSWHRVAIPQNVLAHGVLTRGANRPRLRAVLEGLLEEQLLDEPSHMHFALSPQAASGQPAWVAACDRAWLDQMLGMLEAAQLPVARVVPEFAPPSVTTGVVSKTYVIQGPVAPQLVVTGQQGVSVLPLNQVSLELLAVSETQTILAEPACAGLAEQVFKRPVSLLSAAQRCLQAAQTDWNLAQLEFERSGQERWRKKFKQSWNQFIKAPEWRAARWSAVMLISIQLLGLNVWAWSERSALAGKREAIRNILLQSFPETQVVLDAPMQMAREVQALQQASGAASSSDLEAMLSALSHATSAQQSLSSIDFKDGIARLKGLQLPAPELPRVREKLKAQGFELEVLGDQWLIQARGLP
jgi:general secretion pathway protein L